MVGGLSVVERQPLHSCGSSGSSYTDRRSAAALMFPTMVPHVLAKAALCPAHMQMLYCCPSPPAADVELATFYREASLLSRLHHRNIVQVGGRWRQRTMKGRLWLVAHAPRELRCMQRWDCAAGAAYWLQSKPAAPPPHLRLTHASTSRAHRRCSFAAVLRRLLRAGQPDDRD